MNENEVSSISQECPSILIFLSHNHLEWPKIIKGVMSTVNLPEEQTQQLPFNAKFSTKWHLQNKYYSVVVQLIVMQDDCLPNHSLIESTAEAIIIYWDNTLNDSQQRLDCILANLDQLKPEVCLLICDSFTEGATVSKYEANQWCIDNGWELIELDPQSSSDGDDDSLEDDFVESCGFQRVQGALHANYWSTMKQTAGSVPLNSRTVLTHQEDPFVGYEEPQNGWDEGEPGELPNDNGENFEDLFARFGQMRLTAASLSREDRLDYAERIATAFLGALGGDEEELDTEGENNPDADDEDDVDVHGYSELINSIDQMKLDGGSTSQAGASSDDVSESGESLPGNHRAKAIGSTELLTELGFPVVEPAPHEEGSQGASHSNASCANDDAVKAAASFTVDTQGDDFPVRSYDDIENELKQEELARLVQRASATEEIRNELQENADPKKKFRI